jgi:hypothetical protein
MAYHLRYRCTILGATAEVDVPLSCLIQGDGEELDVDDLEVGDVRLWVENDEGLYNGLYSSAFDGDAPADVFDAEWEDDSLSLVRDDSGTWT